MTAKEGEGELGQILIPDNWFCLQQCMYFHLYLDEKKSQRLKAYEEKVHMEKYIPNQLAR